MTTIAIACPFCHESVADRPSIIAPLGLPLNSDGPYHVACYMQLMTNVCAAQAAEAERVRKLSETVTEIENDRDWFGRAFGMASVVVIILTVLLWQSRACLGVQ